MLSLQKKHLTLGIYAYFNLIEQAKTPCPPPLLLQLSLGEVALPLNTGEQPVPAIELMVLETGPGSMPVSSTPAVFGMKRHATTLFPRKPLLETLFQNAHLGIIYQGQPAGI